MDKNVFKWELAGAVFTIAAGSLLHFAFEWTGYWKPAAAVAAVNESVWEHLKMGFWPLLLFAVVEYIFIRDRVSNFFAAKAAALILIPVSIIVIFYAYTAVLGRNFLILDILTFVIAVFIGQWASYKLLAYQTLPAALNSLSLIVIIILVLTFPMFTFSPPHIFLFKNPLDGGYGIPR